MLAAGTLVLFHVEFYVRMLRKRETKKDDDSTTTPPSQEALVFSFLRRDQGLFDPPALFLIYREW